MWYRRPSHFTATPVHGGAPCAGLQSNRHSADKRHGNSTRHLKQTTTNHTTPPTAELQPQVQIRRRGDTQQSYLRTTFPLPHNASTNRHRTPGAPTQPKSINLLGSDSTSKMTQPMLRWESTSWTIWACVKELDSRAGTQSHSRHSKAWWWRTITNGGGPKGKGKDKGKYKGGKGGRGSWDVGAWSFGRRRGKGDKVWKEKEGGKGRGRGRGSGNRKGKKGQTKGQVGPNQCSMCFGYGPWSRDCPQSMGVNRVQATYGQPQQHGGLSLLQQCVPYPGQTSQPPAAPAHPVPPGGATTAFGPATSYRLRLWEKFFAFLHHHSRPR